MTFYNRQQDLEKYSFNQDLARAMPVDVERALASSHLNSDDFLTLLSPAAECYLELMAQRAHALTVQHFGKVILLYTPLYLANYCTNFCLYCGFAAPNRIRRDRLTLEEVAAEARIISASGLRHILILTGESRKMSSVEYIGQCVKELRPYFRSISTEVYPLEIDEYAQLVGSGVDGLTLYQETYDRALYAAVHPRGPKRDYRYRIEAPERACDAGIRSVNIGALLGLADWRLDAFLTGLHADYLQHLYPAVEVSVSLPRLRPHEGSFQPQHEVRNREFVQILLAMRIFLPRVGIAISTRERSDFRDHLIPLGVTKMSAGSCTQVGGRTHREAETGQFEISDQRDVPAVKQAIESRGYKAIFKDWHPIVAAGVDKAGRVAL
ncbi:MAG: 2-iminoacetate synthase ThiH [Candidatus Latescibacterota bacterium]